MSQRTLKVRVLRKLLYLLNNHRELGFEGAIKRTSDIFIGSCRDFDQHPQVTERWITNLYHDLQLSLDDKMFDNINSIFIY